MVQSARTLRSSALVVAVFASTLALVSHRQVFAQVVTEHPYIAPARLERSTCLGCHPNKEEARFVHTAVVAGCEGCHRATSDPDRKKTTVKLVARGGELCALCHEGREAAVLHGPYKNGECLICHEAHGTEYRGNIRAEVNTLCMACHMADHPTANVDTEARTVTLLGTQNYSFDAYLKSPKISADHPKTAGRPNSSHPVPPKDPMKANVGRRCVSCHDPHASQAAMLLR